ncbi:MAG TPA: thiamine pyrophosphate-dependent dehydrogenase E1 component subunit alpha [Polyangiaceae bacterium]|nr:thiamine pyrophosphate-dependent dehydrogenase E1 component subunit alpha [Polyangiaceae bacterium]
MLRTRIIDEQVTGWQRQGRIRFHIGSLGEECCIIASACALRASDWIFPSYREFGALLMRGMPLREYLGNLFGNAHDPAKGRQMPDHYTGKPFNFGCVSSPIATQIPQAVGFAYASRLRNEGAVIAAYFGDGATSSGEFHAGLTLAGVLKTPNVFLLRNNGWAISCPNERQCAVRALSDKAHGYGIRGVRCDGNNAEETYLTVLEAVEHAAHGRGSTLVEMVASRQGGHSTADDPRLYRSPEEEARGLKEDPVARLRQRLRLLEAWSDDEEHQLRQAVAEELVEELREAELASPPTLEGLFDDVYAHLPEHLREQREKALRFA